jgi:hypothetical protein
MRARLVLVLLVWAVAGAAFAARPTLQEDDHLKEATLGEAISLQPGATFTEHLFRWQCCVYTLPVNVAARYLVDPADRGVSIDPMTGVLNVDANTPAWTVVRVYAILAGGKRIVSHDVHVYTPQSNPLVGTWRQTAELDCFSSLPPGTPGLEWQPVQPIQELFFSADGTYSVTWVPFEVYRDYAGPYTFNLDRKTIILGQQYSNASVTNFRAQGQFEIRPTDPPQLVLKGMWLGKSPAIGEGCGAVFVRVR